MNFNRLHHWHLGLMGAIICSVLALLKLGFHNLGGAYNLTWWVGGFLFWALDDALFHKHGIKTPFYWIEQGLRLIPLYRKISNWVKKFFK